MAIKQSNTQHSDIHSNNRQEVAFVDTSVVDYQSLVDGLPADMEVVLIDGHQDGLQQIADWAAYNSGYDAMHILSHGSAGQVQLGTASLNNTSLYDYSESLTQIGQSLSEDGDILLYGCHVAASETGVDFIGKLAQATGADIAASDDLTSSADKGGDWVLEQTSGDIETAALSLNTQTVLGEDPQPTIENGGAANVMVTYADIGQTFTATQSGVLEKIGFPFDGGGGKTLEIYEVGDDWQSWHYTSNAIEPLHSQQFTAQDTVTTQESYTFQEIVLDSTVNLTEGTQYEIRFTGNTSTIVDSNDNYTGGVGYYNNVALDGDFKFQIFMASATDTTAPTFDSTPVSSNISTTTFDLTADIDEAGTIYYVVVANDAAEPTAAEVKAGTASGGGSVVTSGSQAVSAGGFSNIFNVSGLSANTDYDIYVVAEDDEGTPNLQATVTKVDVTTAAPLNAAPDVVAPYNFADITSFDFGSGITIFIRTLESTNIMGRLEQSDTIESLRNELATQSGMSSDNIKLIFGGHELEDGRTLADYGIQNESTIHVAPKQLSEDIIAIEDQASDVDLSDWTFSDADGDQLTVTITASAGTFAAPSGNPDVQASLNSGSGDNIITLNGSAGDINDWLDTSSNIQYTGAENVSGDNVATITIEAEDASGGTLSSNPTVNIDITEVNDAPTLSATATTPTFTEGGPGNNPDNFPYLFSNVDFDTIESNQNIIQVVITVTNVQDTGKEYLMIGNYDQMIKLEDGVNVSTPDQGLGMDYTVSVDSNHVATVTFDASEAPAGKATPETWESLISDLWYHNDNKDNPTEGARVVTLTTIQDDGGLDNKGIDTNTGLNVSSTVTVQAVNDAPFLDNIWGDSVAFTKGGTAVTLDAGDALTINDVDSDTMASATVQITENYANGEDVLSFSNDSSTMGNITASYEANDGTLTLTSDSATATLAEWEAALKAVTYENTDANTNNTSDRTLTWTLNDGETASKLNPTSKVTIQTPNQAPTVTATGASPTFTENGSGATLFTGASADTIETGQTFSELTLTVTNVTDTTETLTVDSTTVNLTNGATGTTTSNNLTYNVSVTNGIATVTLSNGTLSAAKLNSLIDAIAYNNSSENPSTDQNRVVTITEVKDSGGDDAGGQDTATLSLASTVTVQAVNDAPVLNNLDGDSNDFSLGSAPAPLDSGEVLTITDVDSDTLASTTVQITGHYVDGEDVLSFSNDGSTMGNISASYDANDGTLTLSSASATATLAEWEAALKAVRYENTNDTTVNTADRTLTWTLNDGIDASAPVTTTVGIVRAPMLDLDGDDSSRATDGNYNASFTEGSGAIAIIDADATLEDDGADLTQAFIYLSNAKADDSITLEGRSTGDIVNGITITYTGDDTIMLTGQASKADYLALLKEAQFNNTSSTPDATDREISFAATDTDNNTGNSGKTTVSVTLVNDEPTGAVTLTGTAKQGETLTASNTLADEDGLGDITYQWLRDGQVIDGATRETYTLTSADVGAEISVSASYTDGQGTDEIVTSTATSSVSASPTPPPPVPTEAPTPEPTEPPTEAPTEAPTPEPTVDTVDGVTVETQEESDENGNQTTTINVAPTTDERDEDEQTEHGNLADIPIASDEQGNPVVQVSIPTGVGFNAQAVTPATNENGDLATTLRELLISASEPRTESEEDLNEIIQEGIDAYVPTVNDEAQVTVRTVTLSTAEGRDGPVPSEPIIVTGGMGTGEDDLDNPDRQEALVIDVRDLPSGTVLQLDNVEFAIVIGATSINGGEGRNIVTGDGSSQFIVLGEADDILKGGAGNDTIGSRGGDDELYGGSGDDILFGGTDDDLIDGGVGTDIAVFAYDYAEYSITQLENTEDGTPQWQVSHATEGTDTLVNIEYLEFADVTITLTGESQINDFAVSGLLFF